jgi:hypothetical protein
MRRMMFRQSANPFPINPSEIRYLIEYDFTDPDDPRRSQFYTKLRELLGGPVHNYSSTRSNVWINDLDLARRIRDLAIEHGGIAYVREARTIA